MNSRLGRTGTAAWMTALGLLAAGCSDQIQPIVAPGEQAPLAAVTAGLEISSASASPGERIALAVVTQTGAGESLGAVQGTLVFDAGRLAYLGQAEDASPIVFVGAKSADRGVLEVASFNVTGLPHRAAVLYFQVTGSGYADRLRFAVSAATSVDERSTWNRARQSAVQVVADLPVAANARTLSLADWERIVSPGGNEPLTVPGDTAFADGSNGDMKFGDANLSKTLNISDALFVANVSVGNNSLISSTDAPSRDAVVAGNVVPGNADLNLCGVDAGGNRVINVSDALDIANKSVGNPSLCAGQIIPGRAAPPLGGKPRQVLSCPITTSTTLTKDKIWEIPTPAVNTQVCMVGDNDVSTGLPAVTLTIEAGTRIEADQATLVIGRNAQIQAVGTYLEPITMTCKVIPVARGCWGGLYINGNAPINNGTATSPAFRGGAAGALEATGEGGTGKYGGSDPADNSGAIKYLVIVGAGTRFSATSERNSLTLQGVGSGTSIEYVHNHLGLDDGIEFFGGTARVKHILVTNTEDDALDWVAGWTGKAQFYIVQGCSTACDNGIEADNFNVDGGANSEALPRSAPQIYNITFVGFNPVPSPGFHGMLLRQNTAGTIRNFGIFGYKAGIDIDPQALAPKSGSICTQIASGALSVKYGFLAGNVSGRNGDPDSGDPIDVNATTIDSSTATSGPGGTPGGNCGPYLHDGTNLEALLIADANNHIDTDAGTVSDFIIDPYGSVPDYRPRPGTAFTTKVCDTPPNDGFFDVTATYCGAIKTGGVGAVPWYSGWSLPRH